MRVIFGCWPKLSHLVLIQYIMSICLRSSMLLLSFVQRLNSTIEMSISVLSYGNRPCDAQSIFFWREVERNVVALFSIDVQLHSKNGLQSRVLEPLLGGIGGNIIRFIFSSLKSSLSATELISLALNGWGTIQAEICRSQPYFEGWGHFEAKF